MADYLVQENGSRILLEDPVVPGDALLLEDLTLQDFGDIEVSPQLDAPTDSRLVYAGLLDGLAEIFVEFSGAAVVPLRVSGEIEVLPLLRGNLFVLLFGAQALPVRALLQGSIDVHPEMGGIVYTYPYQTVDVVVARTAQTVQTPLLTSAGQLLNAFVYPGQEVQLDPAYSAPFLHDQVWNLVDLFLLDIRRIRVPRFYDTDGTPEDFVTLHERPVLWASFDADRDVIRVGRNTDDGLAQAVYGVALDPSAARLTRDSVVADTHGVAEFSVVRALGAPPARFQFSIVDRTHADVVIALDNSRTSVAPGLPPPPVPEPVQQHVVYARGVHVCNGVSATPKNNTSIYTYQVARGLGDVRELKLVYIGWYYTGGVDLPCPAQYTVKVAVVHNGTVYPVTLNGSRNIVVDPDQNVVTDPIAGLVVAEGDVITVRTYPTSTGNVPNMNGHNYLETINGVDGRAVGDQVDAVTPPTTTGATAMTGPLLVLGTPAKRNRPFAVFGDGIILGMTDFGAVVDPGDSPYVGAGWGRRSIYKAGRPGLCLAYRASVTGSSLVRRRPIVEMATCEGILFQTGANDIYANIPAAQIVNSMRNAWQQLSEFAPVLQGTITPQTTSTDDWATLANQGLRTTTPPGNFGPGGLKEQVNDLLRNLDVDNEPYLAGILDISDAGVGGIQSSPNSGKWYVTGVPNQVTRDGAWVMPFGADRIADYAWQALRSSQKPACAVAPVVTGLPTIGATITCDSGVWQVDCAKDYQWLRDGVAIPGALGITYTLGPADVGARISCRVTALSLGGTTRVVSNRLEPTADSLPLDFSDSFASGLIATVSGSI